MKWSVPGCLGTYRAMDLKHSAVLTVIDGDGCREKLSEVLAGEGASGCQLTLSPFQCSLL